MSNLTVKGNASGTGTVILEAPNTNSNRTITLPDSTSTLATTADVAAVVTGPTLGTAVASTSGTSIDFTGIPSTAKRVTVMLNGVSAGASEFLKIQLGTSSGVEDTGYSGASSLLKSTVSTTSLSDSFFLNLDSSSGNAAHSGAVVLSKVSGNSWVCSGSLGSSLGVVQMTTVGGTKTVSATLDRVRVATHTGTSFDAGTINISWE